MEPGIDAVLQWAELVKEIAPACGLSPTVVLTVIALETGWTGNPDLVYPHWPYPVGLMQIVPDTVIPGRPTTEELKDPRTNIEWGCQILAGCMKRQGLSWRGLMAYSGGSYWAMKPGSYWQRYWLPFIRAQRKIEEHLEAENGSGLASDPRSES